jgi:hypothetical protein
LKVGYLPLTYTQIETFLQLPAGARVLGVREAATQPDVVAVLIEHHNLPSVPPGGCAPHIRYDERQNDFENKWYDEGRYGYDE